MTTMMTSARLPASMVQARAVTARLRRWPIAIPRSRDLSSIPEPRMVGYDAEGNEYVLLAPGAGSTVVPFVVSETPGGPVPSPGAKVEDVTLSPGQNVAVPVTMPGISEVYVIVRAQSKMRVWGMVAGGFALGWLGGYLTWVKLGKSGYSGGMGYTPVYGPSKKRTKRGGW